MDGGGSRPRTPPRIRDEVVDPTAELRLDGLARVALEDPRLRLDHLAERPERDAVAVRKTTAAAPRDETGVVGERALELPDEAALPDAGHADERHELNGAVAASARDRVDDQAQLLLAADQRRERARLVRVPELRPCAKRLVDRDGVGLSLRLEDAALAVLDRRLGRAERALADEHGVRVRRLLDPERRRDDVADRDALARTGDRVHLDDRFTGVDRDLHAGDRVADRERRADRALGVVLVRDRRAEDGHHGVADVLLERAAEALELAPHPRDLRTDGAAEVLGVAAVAEHRRVDEVGEQDGDDLPLLAGGPAHGRPARGQKRAASGSSELHSRHAAMPRG